MVRAIMRMKRPRRYIPLPELLASALADLLPQEQRDDLRAHKVSAKQVIKLFSPDHNHLHSLGGSDAWWNITMMLREPHKEKSKRDTSIVAKSRRIEKEPEKWRDLTKPKKARPKPKRKHWHSRPLRGNSRWPKGRKFRKV